MPAKPVKSDKISLARPWNHWLHLGLLEKSDRFGKDQESFRNLSQNAQSSQSFDIGRSDRGGHCCHLYPLSWY